jgi:hypothetical protein
MPVDINRLTEGWLELESDPGTKHNYVSNFINYYFHINNNRRAHLIFFLITQLSQSLTLFSQL